MPQRFQNPEILLQHAGFVRALARAVVFDAELARDVEQETWLTALQHAPRNLRSPRAWLAAIVRSAAQRAGRRASSRRDAEQRMHRDRCDAAAHDGFPSPDELLEQEPHEALVHVHACGQQPVENPTTIAPRVATPPRRPAVPWLRNGTGPR